MTEETLCGAEWYRTFTMHGLLHSETKKVSQVFCALYAGHSGKHKAWLGGFPRTGLIEW